MFFVSLESSQGRQVHPLGFMVFGLAVQKFLNITENYGGIKMCLGCCWKDLDEKDLMEFIW
jgi:hypothetical protein